MLLRLCDEIAWTSQSSTDGKRFVTCSQRSARTISAVQDAPADTRPGRNGLPGLPDLPDGSGRPGRVDHVDHPDLTVTVRAEPPGLVLSVRGVLDAEGGRLLQEAAVAALRSLGVRRGLTLDLRDVDHWTVDGLQALSRCAQLVPGVVFRLGAMQAAGAVT